MAPWVFRRLHGMKINIAPIFMVGHHGFPPCVLSKADGGTTVCVQELSETPCLREAVDVMRQFSSQQSGSDPCFIVVWYVDGDHELMDSGFVLKLALEDSVSTSSWREQLVALQGFVVPHRVESGIYRSSEDDLFGSCGNLRDGAAKVGINMLTKALAERAMGAVKADGKEISHGRHAATPTSLHRQRQEVRLDFMRAVFVIDKKGTLWFSHAAEVHVRQSVDPAAATALPTHDGGSLALPRYQLAVSELPWQAAEASASIEERFCDCDPAQSYQGEELEVDKTVTRSHKVAEYRRCRRKKIAPPQHYDAQLASLTSEELRVKSPRSTPVKLRWDDLPCWARQSSRVALQELIRHSHRSLKQVRADTAHHSNPKEPRTKPRESIDGESLKSRTAQYPASDIRAREHSDITSHTAVFTNPKHDDVIYCRSLRPRSAQCPAPCVGADVKLPAVDRNELKLHIGRGNVMSYRWIARVVAKPNHGGSVLGAMGALHISQEAMGLHVAQREPFLLIAVPDLFMTLESMERGLGGILEHNPRGKILLVGSLGLPGTQWADGEMLDARTHAHGLSVLLWELLERGELCLSPPLCVVFVGLGSGANAVLHFAGTFLVDGKFTALRNSTRFLALANPFPAAPTATSEIQKVKRQLQVLKKTLDRGAHPEKLQSLIAAIFSAEYIQQSGRATVLEDFWATRKMLELPELQPSKSAPSTPRSEHARNIKPHGVLKCIDGILRGTTMEALDSAVNVPVLLIISTRDALGSNAELGSSIGAEDVDSLQQLVSGNKHRRIMVCPVQAGREVLQEAPVRTLEILWEAIRAAQMQPIVAHCAGSGYDEGRAFHDDVLDVIGASGDCAISPPFFSETCGLRESTFADQVNPPTDIPEEADRFSKSQNETPSIPSERKRDDTSPKPRRAREFDVRKERAAERKAKSERLKRQQELDRLKRAKREQDELLEQQQECIAMHQEDERSAAAEKHNRDLEVWAASVQDAKERALELTATRDASEQELIEDQLARDRADQHIQRNELFRKRKMDLLDQGDADEKFPTSAASDQLQENQYDKVALARDSCRNLLAQLLALRQRIVKAMQMELLRREQLETFQSQYDRLELDLRQAERLQRTYARGGVTAGILGDVSVQELRDHDASVARQHILLGKYQSVLKERREIWDLCVSHVQKLKAAIRAEESNLRTKLKEIRVDIAALRRTAESIRAKNENLSTLRASVESKTKIMENRVDVFMKEQSLLNLHSGPYFDSDIWQQGVMQRMSKARFAEDLQVGLRSLRCGIEHNIQQMKLIDETLARDVTEGQKVEMTTQKLRQIALVSEERLDRMASKTVMQELRDVLDAQQKIKSDDAPVSAKSDQRKLAETIRNKASHQRRLDEKQWVALDILINGDLYNALSVVEKEELQLNDEYKTEVTREDVARLLGLPHEIQLALPYMKSAAEIDAHKLLTTYTLEHGEVEFAKADERSQDDLRYAPSEETNASAGRRTFAGEELATNTILKLGEGVAHAEMKKNQKAINLVDTMSDIATKKLCENDGELAIRTGERQVYHSASNQLGLQESRVHSFTIADLAPAYSVDLKITITFSGRMDARGFNRGRIGAVLRRNTDDERGLVTSTGECIGYSPHARQKLNTGDQFYQTPGTVFIQHSPRRVPLACGTYEVEVTALGATEYSVVVVAGQCELCASLVEKRIEEARQLKMRLTDLEGEQSDMWEGVRLRERQYHVCNALIEEAGSECTRCQEAIDELSERLRPRNMGKIVGSLTEWSTTEDLKASMTSSEGSGTRSLSSTSRSTSTLSTSTTATSVDSPSSLELSETERAKIWDEIAAIETEHMHWGRLFTTRCQEKASIKQALDGLMKLRRDGRAENICLEERFQQISAEIPIVVEFLKGPNAAAGISRELNLHWCEGSSGHRSSSGGSPESLMVSLETPAGRIRQAFERGGWEILTLEEQQWVTLDQSMCPDKYEWLQRQQDQEALSVLERGYTKRSKKPRKKPPLDRYRFRREELTRILAESSDDLNQHEMYVRKLLHKFHDDTQLVSQENQPARAADHDVSLAERTRMKNPHHRTTRENEWVSLDKILNPLIWRRAKGGVPGTHNDQRPIELGKNDESSDTQPTWTCPFNRDDLLKIWAHTDGTSLETEDERRAFKLLSIYNGTNPGSSIGVSRSWRSVRLRERTQDLDTDIDERLRCLQQELDRVAHSSNPKITSSVLHVAPQRYPTNTLRLHLEAEIDRLLREQVRQRERKNVYLIEDFSSSEEEDESHRQGKKRENRKTRRSKRRSGREDMSIFDARKRMLLESRKTPLERENARRIANLGPGGCPACMSNPCKRMPVVNLEETYSRLERIADELHFARTSTENLIESTLPLSVQRDGGIRFRRIDFMEELSSEQSYLRHMIKLHLIDEEFHEANRTSRQHIESVALHGYQTLLWTKDARVALEREHSRLVARVVVVEIVRDILEWMLEGWHFGERPSRHATLGNVPGVQMDGLIKTDIDTEETGDAPASDTRTLREQEEDRATTFTVPPGIDGSIWNDVSERVVKEGGVHDKKIGFVERAMHFGLFCVVVMYFRARWLLRQQRKHALEFKLGWRTDTSVRAQRKRVSKTTISSTQAGYQRVKVRKEKEQAEVLADFTGFVAVEKKELDASHLIQRILRGHIGRKAAHRWREKRAECKAANSLMVSAAVFIQRFLRGSRGRRRAKTIRAGIAKWLARLIDDEAREFEAEVLRTNKLDALQRSVEELVIDETDSDT